MNLSLLGKRYNIYIISFILLSTLFGGPMFASPGDPIHAHPNHHGNRLYFTPACPIITQNFNTTADTNGATADTSSVGWYLDASKVPNAAYFAVKSHRLKAQTLGGEGVWYSKVFSIAGYTGVQIDAKVSTEGSKTSAEYVKIFHKLNGGPEILDTALYGNFGTPTITSPQMTGNTVQIVIRIYDTTSGNSEYYIENYDVFKETGPCTVTSGITVAASASNSGVLTCTNASTTLSATTTATGTTTYSWTGPNSFTSTSANPVVTTAGTYTVTGTNAAGTGTASVTVTSNTTAPASVTATASGTLSCTTTSVTLTGSSTTSGTTFRWTGPNSFTATGATASASAAGTYIVTATNPTTGCTATASVAVTSNTTASASVTATASGPLSCTTTSVTLTGSSTTSGTTFSWTGPNSFTATGATASAGAAGTYIVTATNPTTGCTATASTIVVQNFAAPAGITAINNGPLTCTAPSVTLTGSSSTTGINYSWAGPNSFTATTATASVSTAGTYTLTETNPANGCTATASTVVAQNTTPPANVTATSSGALTCTTTSVTLTGSSSTSGANYNWTGPNSFTANGTAPTANTAGLYTLTVTNTANGCTATATTTVAQNIAPPASVAIATTNGSTVLTCANNYIGLTGSSSTSGVSYTWTGPNSFSSTSAATTVFNPGVYTLTVTNPVNGCTSATTITISQNVVAPTGVVASPSAATLTCSSPNVALTGSSTTSGVSYSWTGPNSFTASGTTANVGAAGTYILTATDPTNGCTTSTASTITQNFTAPTGITAINNGPLTCSTTSVTLTGNSSTTGVTYSWSGPNNFTASTATVSVNTAGTYILTVTNPANGCTATANTIVAQNTAAPAGLAITSSSTNPVLTCTNTSVSLTATSSLTGASYSWTGPNSFTGSAAAVSITAPGTYSVTATNTANGCASNVSANVIQNITPPVLLATVSNPPNATLTCSNSSVALTASSAATGVNYSWTGPNSFTSSAAAATVTSPGTYTVTATNPSNGCSSTASVVITQNIAAPAGVTTTANPVTAQITCAHPNVVLTSSATTAGVTYNWSGPGGYAATGASATVTAPGVYTVTVTDPSNGCVTSIPGTVTKNVSVPVGLSASTSDVISCFTPTIGLQGASTTPGATYTWTGPGGFTASTDTAQTGIPGNYTLTVTNPANGCSASTGTIAVADTASPAGVIAANSGPLNCINSSVKLVSSSTTAGVDYLWVTPDNNFISGATVIVTMPGIYTIQVTNNSNGCSTQATTTVLQNTTGCTGSSALTPISNGSSRAMTGEGIAEDTVNRFSYKAYPNPFSTTAFIEFTAPVSSLVTVEIYSSYGSREKLLFSSMVTANQSYKLELSAAGLSSGTHFCIIRNNGKVYSTKLILIK